MKPAQLEIHSLQELLAGHKTSPQAEEALLIEPTITAGTSRSGRNCVMSQRMAESMSQWGFFGNTGMHYMAHQSTAPRDETPEVFC